MGCLGCMCKFSAAIVLLIAIFIGSLASGLVGKTGVFRVLDGYADAEGREMLKGIAPAMHEGTPWGFTEDQIPDLTGQTIIVTGANVGLGYWTAYHVANKGATVIMACRSETKCQSAVDEIKQATGAKGLVPMTLDLSSFASIRAFAQEFASKHTDLHSLVLNAGIMMPDFYKTVDGLEAQLGVNHFGHFLLTQLLEDMLVTTGAVGCCTTVTVVSSNAHYNSYPEGVRLTIQDINDESTYNKQMAYGQSKLANVLFAQELSSRLSSKNVLVNVIHPGAVDTDLKRHVTEVIKSYFGDSAVGMFKAQIAQIAWHPRDAALTQVFTSVAPSIKQDRVTGRYFHPIARFASPDPHASNKTLQTGLWDLTEAYVASH